tara:strand:+ start:11007 stop:11324 length:318 start_codon:yes stop_codon:yes gene_type:complete
MTISHTWTINSLEYADAGGLVSVVNQVNWTCFSDDGAGHTWENSDSTRLEVPDPATFEAYAGITEADALSWLGAVFITDTEAVNAAAIQKLINAETTSAGSGVPW